MQSITNATIGPLIAYLVPGITMLVGLGPFVPVLRRWFEGGAGGAPTVGGFLYLTVAALTAGMTVSAVRWALLDTLHARTGLRPPRLDFSRLGRNVEAFTLLIEIHYRHYQFYANMFVATAAAYVCYRLRFGWRYPFGWPDLAFIVLELVFFATSRDTLRKYYARTGQLLRAARPLSRRAKGPG